MNTRVAAHVVREVATSPETKECARLQPQFFTRQRKMPFTDLLYFFLNTARECLQVRLNNFFRHVKQTEVHMTQQAISSARSQFDHTPFEKMTRALVFKEYGGEYSPPTWNGYHVFAGDGSTLPLPNTPRLRDRFGVMGANGQVAGVGVSMLHDVLNGWVIDASLQTPGFNERAALKSHVEFLRENLPEISSKCVLLLDRGYASADMVKFLTSVGISYVIRCPKNWNVVKHAPLGVSCAKLTGGLRVLVIKFTFANGKVYTLLSNLDGISCESFQDLYTKRWCIETDYDTIKNKIQMENFTGSTPNAILQDFWVAITLANLVAITVNDATEIIQANNDGKTLRYDYRPNVSQLVAALKDDFVIACRLPSDEAMAAALDAIIRRIAAATVPIRPGRSSPRSSVPKKRQFPMTRKSNV